VLPVAWRGLSCDQTSRSIETELVSASNALVKPAPILPRFLTINTATCSLNRHELLGLERNGIVPFACREAP